MKRLRGDILPQCMHHRIRGRDAGLRIQQFFGDPVTTRCHSRQDNTAIPTEPEHIHAIQTDRILASQHRRNGRLERANEG